MPEKHHSSQAIFKSWLLHTPKFGTTITTYYNHPPPHTHSPILPSTSWPITTCFSATSSPSSRSRAPASSSTPSRHAAATKRPNSATTGSAPSPKPNVMTIGGRCTVARVGEMTTVLIIVSRHQSHHLISLISRKYHLAYRSFDVDDGCDQAKTYCCYEKNCKSASGTRFRIAGIQDPLLSLNIWFFEI
jgi:hypothetical protein